MAQRSLATLIRKRQYTFARQLASPLSDSRHRCFVHNMISGLVVANRVHLSTIARPAATSGEGT